MERKVIKYDELVSSIRANNNNITVHLMVFAVGYIGSVTEQYFHTSLLALGVPERQLQKITQTTITATLGAFDKMAKERGAAINTAAPVRKRHKKWMGDAGQLRQRARRARGQ